jgi:tight adherence protein B
MDDLGYPFEACLDWLRVELANVHADNLIELLKACGESGGYGLVESLMRTSANLRSDLIVHGELQAKQGWVAGTAKLAVFAPWLVAWMLSRRPEAFDFYNSAVGNSILLGGLGLCVLAYILINRFGRQAQPRRVFPS